jgi:hypothetical protein
MLQATTPLGRRRRTRAIVGAAAWIGALAVVVGLAAGGRESPPPAVAPIPPAAANGTAAPTPPPPDTRLEPNARITLVHGPMGVTIGAGAVWVATAADLRLRRIDPATDSVTAVIDLPFVAPASSASPLATASGETAFSTVAGGRSPAGHDLLPVVAIGAGSVWVLGAPAADGLVRVEPATGAVLGRVRLPEAGTGIVSGPGGTWVTTDAGLLIGIDTARTRLGRVVRFGNGRVSAAAGSDSTWVSSSDGRIVRLDQRGRTTATIDGGGGPIAVAGGSVWVRSDRTLIRIDEQSGRSVERRDIATSGDVSIAWALPSIVGLDYRDTISRIAPREGWVADTTRTLWICRPDRGEIWRIQTPGR